MNFSANLLKLLTPSSSHTLLSGHIQFKLTAARSSWSWVSPKWVHSSLKTRFLKDDSDCASEFEHLSSYLAGLGDFPSFPPISLICIALFRRERISQSKDGQQENYSHTNIIVENWPCWSIIPQQLLILTLKIFHFSIKLPGYQGILWMSKYNTLQVCGWCHMKRWGHA